jgi:hypothetical protein
MPTYLRIRIRAVIGVDQASRRGGNSMMPIQPKRCTTSTLNGARLTMDFDRTALQHRVNIEAKGAPPRLAYPTKEAAILDRHFDTDNATPGLHGWYRMRSYAFVRLSTMKVALKLCVQNKIYVGENAFA